MKTAHALAAVLLVTALGGCNKSSDRYRGVEQQPAHPEQQSPGTVPTTPSGGPAAKTLDSPTAEPAEDPDTLGTTRTPPSVDTPTNSGTANSPETRAANQQ